MISDPILGQKIKYYRKLHSMTQEELAEEIGVATVHIVNIERNRRGISLEKLVLICQCFSISLADILPIEERVNIELRNKWISEILDKVSGLDTVRLEVVKTMVSSL